MRIIHLDTGEDWRGGQVQLLMLARGLAESGHKQLIVTPDGTALESRARQEGFRVFSLPRHDPFNAHGIFQLRQQLLSEPFHIIHAHDGKGQTISWLASMGRGMVRVASRRVIYAPPRKIDTRLKYGRTCNAVIAISHYIRQLLVDAGVPPTMVEVIYDGVTLPESLPGPAVREQMRARWRYEPGDFIAGHISTATNEKGLEVAEEAARLVGPRVPEVQFAIAISARPPRLYFGGVGYVSELPSAEGGRTFRGNYRPIPCSDPLSQFFAAIDLYIMPSRAEGLGSSAIAAMAHGVPVIASRVGGLPEIVAEGETGWLVPAGDARALADAIVHAASDRARLVEMGAKARQRSELFSSTLMVERTEALYERLLQEKSLDSNV